MSFWEVLGIDCTEDVSAIKKAYAKKLKIFHPEDDPEGYQRLREAYDGALKEAKNNRKKSSPPGESGESKGFAMRRTVLPEECHEQASGDDMNVPPPVNILEGFIEDEPDFEEIAEEFIGKVQTLYDDFFSRINIENWKETLNSQVMWYIGNREILNDRMMEFLMDNHYLPKEVWDLLESNFNWNGQEEHLYEEYPERFIDYLFKQVNSTSELRYCYFKEAINVDYEAYLRHREEAFEALCNNDLEHAQKCIEIAQDIYPDDPDLAIIKGRYHLHLKDVDKALGIFEDLLQMDGEDMVARYYRARALYEKGRIQEALDDCKHVQQHMLDNPGFLFLFAECHFKLEEFSKAKELILKLLKMNPHGEDAKALLKQVNIHRARQLRKKREKGAERKKAKLELKGLYKELGKLGSRQMMFKLSRIMVKAVIICYLFFISQIVMVGLATDSLGFKDVVPADNIGKFITSSTKVHEIKNSEDMNKLSPGINVVEGKLANATFMDLLRVTAKDKNGKTCTSYLSEKEAKKQNVFDDLDGYVCMGTLGDKRVIMIVNYDEAEQIYKTQSLDFKGVIHYNPSRNLINAVKKRWWKDKFETDFIADKVIDTNTVLLKDRKIALCILSVILIIQIAVVVWILRSGYKLIKENRRF